MSKLKHRYKAWIVFEAETPLSVGNGESGLTTDRLVATNAAGIPFIPGTGLTGALRASLAETMANKDIEKIFGYAKGNEGQGSRLIVNSAYLIGEDGSMVLDGLKQVNESGIYYQILNNLPIRDHARINERGATFEHGKFDEQICYKGTPDLRLVSNSLGLQMIVKIGKRSYQSLHLHFLELAEVRGKVLENLRS